MKPSGFTLIELLVVVSIMLIVTSAFLLRQSRFDSSTLLRSLAYSTALSVRQSQIYGTSVLGTTTSSGLTFASGYGIHMTSGTPTQYTLFADLNSNGRYDAGEDVKVFTFGKGYQISKACVSQISPAIQICTGAGLSTLDIMFRRPNPDACFSSDSGANAGGPTACQPGGGQVYSSAYIQVQAISDPANSRGINISQTGQISVGVSGS